MRSAPKELARRGLDDGTERLRGQLRDAAQHGQRDDYGGDRIEDTAAAGGRQAGRAAEKLLKRKKRGRTDPHGESPPAEQTSYEQPAEADPQAPQARSSRTAEQPKIKTREAVACGDMTPGETGGAGPARPARNIRPETKTREAASRRVLPEPGSQTTQGTGELVREQDHTSATGQMGRPAPQRRQHDPGIQTSRKSTQCKRGFVQEQGRSMAIKQTEKRQLQTAPGQKIGAMQNVPANRSYTGSVHTDHAVPKGSSLQPGIPSAHAVRETGRRAGSTVKTARAGGKTVGRASRRTVKTAGQTAQKAVKTIGRTAQTAQKTAVATARATQRATQAARMTAKAAVVTAKAVAKATVVAAKAAVAAMKSLVTAIAAGGWVTVVIVVLVCLIGLLVASPFGIFFAEDSAATDSVTPSAAVAQINSELSDHLSSLWLSGAYDSMEIQGQPPAWSDVLAVFAAKTAGAEDGVSVAVLDHERVDLLRTVFWDMTKITTEEKEAEHPASGDTPAWTEKVLSITITPRTPDDMQVFYSFTDQQNTALDELLASEAMLISLAGDLTINDQEAKDLLIVLPDGLSPERRAVVETACRLVGKINYFWGGKSLVLGWDDRWGSLQKVWADGSSTTGTWRPYGLDCSGFVDWVFYNMSGGEYIIGHGGGAKAQHSYCTDISWEEAQPGDLVFYPANEHVGIVGGRDEDGNLLVIHCASSANNVVITGADGFTMIGRPVCFSEQTKSPGGKYFLSK